MYINVPAYLRDNAFHVGRHDEIDTIYIVMAGRRPIKMTSSSRLPTSSFSYSTRSLLEIVASLLAETLPICTSPAPFSSPCP